jgi:type VI secretion system protein ImpB
MPRESTQTKLSRVRPPRVQITYDVQVGDATEIKEIPFVMGVLSDLSGNPTEELPKLKDRKFVEVTPDNFDDVLASTKPHLAYSVKNKLVNEPDAPKVKVDLAFRSLGDFEPERVANQIKPLRELLELRSRLADLRGTLQTNQTLDELLQEVINSSEKMQQLRNEVRKAEGGDE